MKPVLYFAAPLFSEAELTFNLTVARQLEQHFDVYLPQRDGGLFCDLVNRGHSVEAASSQIFEWDVAAIRRCDVLLLVLDGRAVDEGAAFELGLAFALNKVCVGLQTDPRRLLPMGNNPMLTGPLIRLFGSVDDLSAWAASFSTVVAGKSDQRYSNDVGSKQ